MVSLRRRRLLGLRSGLSSLPVQLTENGSTAENSNRIAKPMDNSEASLASSSSSKEDTGQYFPDAGKQIKRRKKHRRKHYEDQEPCIMRGVYFKNMKWQAAIKVDKKQIHLGTVGSQEDAARLYDRAAFMCGREPNFELPEEDKRELRQYNWEEFLAITRNAITTKKHHRRIGGAPRRKRPGIQPQVSEKEPERGTDGSSMSEEDEDAQGSAS